MMTPMSRLMFLAALSLSIPTSYAKAAAPSLLAARDWKAEASRLGSDTAKNAGKKVVEVGGGIAKKAGQQALKALDTDGDGEISIVRERMPNECLRTCCRHHLRRHLSCADSLPLGLTLHRRNWRASSAVCASCAAALRAPSSASGTPIAICASSFWERWALHMATTSHILSWSVRRSCLLDGQ